MDYIPSLLKLHDSFMRRTDAKIYNSLKIFTSLFSISWEKLRCPICEWTNQIQSMNWIEQPIWIIWWWITLIWFSNDSVIQSHWMGHLWKWYMSEVVW